MYAYKRLIASSSLTSMFSAISNINIIITIIMAVFAWNPEGLFSDQQQQQLHWVIVPNKRDKLTR